MHLIWHGTASVEIVSGQGKILFDPFVPLEGSPVSVKPEDYDGFTDIFVTHGHLDHICSLPEIAERNPDVRIHCTETPFQTLLRKGVSERNLTIIRFGDLINLQGFSIRILHGKHAVLPKVSLSRLRYMLKSPARGNIPYIFRENRICPENEETVFYQIEAEGKTVSLMGSMNLRPDTEYPMESDLLVLPYNGWEDNYPPAVRIIERLNPKRVVLDHYDDTFPPVTMPLDLSPLLDKYSGLVTTMEPGKAVTV